MIPSAVPRKPLPVEPAPRSQGRRVVAVAAPLPAVDDAADAGRIRTIFDRLRGAVPEPQTELHYRNPFTLLVAVLLSAQATDASVNKATKALFDLADTPAAMLDLGEERLKGFIKTIGLYNTKAKNVLALCRRLLDDHAGTVPRERDVLETLPGVGRKTANVVVNNLHGDPAIAVDTHVFRVSNRLPVAAGATPLAVALYLRGPQAEMSDLRGQRSLPLAGQERLGSGASPTRSRAWVTAVESASSLRAHSRRGLSWTPDAVRCNSDRWLRATQHGSINGRLLVRGRPD